MKEFSDIQFEFLVHSFIGKLESLYECESEFATNLNAFTNDFIDENLIKRKNDILSKPLISELLQFKYQKSGLSELTDLDLIKIFCSDHNLNIEVIGSDMAEYEAILLLHDKFLYKIRQDSFAEENGSKPDYGNKIFLNQKVFTKIDYIRIIYTLVKMKAFIKEDGTYPYIKDIINLFGKTIGLDLSEYQKDLSKALKNPHIEPNIEIFEKMTNKMTAIHTSKLEKPD